MITSDPACASDNDQDVICAANAIINNVNAVAANRFTAGKWAGFISLGGGISSSPVCTTLGIKGQVMCFIRSTNTAQYANRFNSGTWVVQNWSGWRGVTGGAVFSRISCGLLSSTSGSLGCATGSTSTGYMYAGSFNGTSWTAFTKVGNKPIWGGPACAALGNGRALCVAVEINNIAGNITGP